MRGVTFAIFDISKDQHAEERPRTLREQRWEVTINKYTMAQQENNIPVREFSILEQVAYPRAAQICPTFCQPA